MVENPYIESPFTRLGRTELIAMAIIILIRLKYPDDFINIFQTMLNTTDMSYQIQIVIIISSALTLGLLINLGIESTKVFFNTRFYFKSQSKKKIEMLKDTFDGKYTITEVKTELNIKFEPKIKNNPYEHYFKHPEDKIIFYNLIRTIGNRYSRLSHTESPEYLFNISAYFTVYYFILIGLLLIILPKINIILVDMVILSLLGLYIFFFWYSSHITFKRLDELMELALIEIVRDKNVFEDRV